VQGGGETILSPSDPSPILEIEQRNQKEISTSRRRHAPSREIQPA
jgi:hypothetical protein